MNIRQIFKPNGFNISIAIAVAIVSAYLIYPSFLEQVELKTLDVRFKLRPKIERGDEIAIVAIDEKSLKELGRWPWSRKILAKLADSLTDYGVKAVGYDIVFAEGSRDRSEDAALAEAIGRSGRTILGYYFTFGEETSDKQGDTLEDAYEANISATVTFPMAEHLVGNIDVINQKAAGSGYFNIFPDADGTVRWVPLAIGFGEKSYPPLSLRTLRQYLDNPPLTMTMEDYGVSNIKLGDISIPVNEDGMIMVNYYGRQKTFPHYSVSDIIEHRVPRELLKDRIVLIGATAVGIYDMRVTPFDTVYPGVEIHATVMDNVLHGRFVTSPKWLALVDIFFILLIGILLGVFVPKVSALKSFILSSFILAGYLAFNLYLFSFKGIWLNAVFPSLTAIACYPMIILYRYMSEEKRAKWLKNMFQFYVSSSVMEEMLKNPDMLKLGGEERELSVLFSDIRGFTTISENLSPAETVHLLNEYLTAMTEIVFEYGGYLDKYIGDAVMAVYGAPVYQNDHAIKACDSALKMISELRILQNKWKSEGLPELNIGIGINTGPMVVGNMGSEKRFDYTVIGDSVNLASRLEGLNKAYGTNIIINESVYMNVKDTFICRELDTVTVKGKTLASKIYELMGKRGENGLEEVAESFRKGLEYYRNGNMNNAVICFEEILKLKPEDAPSMIYLDRIKNST